MIGFIAKVVIGGAAMYGVSKLLAQTQIVEKVIAAGTEKVDQVLTKVNEAYTQEQAKQHVNGSTR